MTADARTLTTGEEIQLLKARVRLLEQLISEIKRDLARSSAPVLMDASDGTVAIRDPDILAQEQATGMRGSARVPLE